jgi:hypothetical protein
MADLKSRSALSTGLAPGLAPSRHFQPSLGFGPPAVSGGAGPGLIRRPHHQPRRDSGYPVWQALKQPGWDFQ